MIQGRKLGGEKIVVWHSDICLEDIYLNNIPQRQFQDVVTNETYKKISYIKLVF